jgi:hypothetical protein
LDDTPGLRVVQPPLLDPNGLYDRETVIQNLGVSHNTFDGWVKAGLNVISPNTRRMFVIGGDVIEFMRRVGRKAV